jgi:prephenate dehydratase
MTENRIIAFQGIAGAYSDLAARAVFPDAPTLACTAFEDVFEAVCSGRATYGIVPIENSIAGRVADNHHLLPQSGLFIVAEHFQKIEHSLCVLPGTKAGEIKTALSHPQALAQCRNNLRQKGLTPETFGNTAMAAAEIVRRGDKSVAAISSRLAAELNGLEILEADIQDEDHNTTRFLVLAREAIEPPAGVAAITTLVFRVRNVPAALYKALGGFATNGVNMTKLESYMLAGSFNATQFYCDVMGRPSERGLALALEELAFFAPYVKLLGTYPAHPYRQAQP